MPEYRHVHRSKGSFFTGFGGAMGCLFACLIFAAGLFFAARYYFNQKVEELKSELVYEPPENVKRASADKSALTIKGITVKVSEAKIDTSTDAKLIVISLYVSTNDPTIKYDHHMWGSTGLLSSSRVRVADQFGNRYRLVDADLVMRDKDIPEVVTIRSDSSATDYLFVERPVAAAEYLDIDLVDPHFGNAAFHFRIPRRMWSGK